ncbi:MAG: ATP synthase F1 subunit delta [Clostridia bacterium]|nr:ATP synthase F1 subunit delta [Clostridia bacterium]MBQ8973425.1 ATP synthase F1 subunit delta [Clostridia bacterium]
MTDFVREYSEGLYMLAEDEHLEETLDGELQALNGLFSEQPDFIRLLSSEGISREERCRVAEDVLRGEVHPYVLNFIKILCERNAFRAFSDCANAFHRQYHAACGIEDAWVTTAVPLSEEERATLVQKLEAISGKRVQLHTKEDASVIGGVRVEMQGRRMDNTIETRLKEMRRTLLESV